MRSDKAIIVRATDDAVVGWSLGATELSGYRADEILGRSLHVLLPLGARADRERVTLIGKGGVEVPVSWTHTPVHDEGGRLIAFTDVLSPVERAAPDTSGQALAEAAAAIAERRADNAGDAQLEPATTASRVGVGVGAELTFRQVVESLPLLCWVTMPDGTCEYISSSWSAYTGVPCGQLVNRGWLAIVHPDDRARILEALRAPGDGRVLLTVRMRRHDGCDRWCDLRANALCDERGKLLKWFGANIDVHEARLTHEALQKQREHLQRIIAAAPGAFFSYRWAADGTPSLAQGSAAMQALLGDTIGAIEVGVAALAHVHPDDRPRVQESIAVSARTLQPWRMDYRMLTRHRGTIWVEARSVPVTEPDGAIQWFGFVEDISERKQAEQSLRSAQAQLVTALEAGGMGTSRWDVARARMELHESLLTLFGHAREHASEPPDFFEFILDEDLPGVRDALSSREPELSFGYRVRRPDGALRWLSARGRRERDPVDQSEHVTLLHVDVTQQRRATGIQLRSQKLEALGTLAGGIAHDFNNMLHAIAGNCALALRQLSEEHAARPMLEAIALASERAADLVRRLLQFSRPGEPRRDLLRLREIVREALKLVRATVPLRIEIREELSEHDPWVEADATQVHQVILHLATNAAHAVGEASGFLQVRLEILDIAIGTPHAPPVARSGRYAALHVTDSGSGMDAATASRIFDPFFTTKEVGRGAGLGLSMVHGIMKSLGGSVWVHTALGEGTTFTLLFPLREQPVKQPSRPPPVSSERAVGCVLFVDDEQILVELGTHTLEALGYEVLAFSQPRAALRAFLAAPDGVDAVITDLSMPELSGFDLAARVREVRPDLPIVMMSGNVGPDELAVARRLALTDVLIKPVSINALARTLSKALRRPSSPRS